MISIYKRPPAIVLSDNPAWFEINNTGDNKQIKASVFVDGAKIADLFSFSSINGRAFFEFSEIFSSVMDGSYSVGVSFSNVFKPVIGSNLLKNFSIVFSDSPENTITETIAVIIGGYTPDIFNTIPLNHQSFYDLVSYNPFLSTRPKDIVLYSPFQPHYLFFLTPDDLGTITTTAIIYKNDGSGIGKLLAADTLTPNTLYRVDCSYNSLIKPYLPEEFGKDTVFYYELSFASNVTGLIKTTNFTLDFKSNYNGSFVFLNSLGGYETFAPISFKHISSSTSSDIASFPTAPNQTNNLYQYTQHKAKQVLSLNTGKIDSSTANWLSQLVYSKKCFWADKQNNLTPIILLDNKLDFRKYKPDLYDTDIKFMINPILTPDSQ